jgi:hypothetical protein
LNCWRPGGRRPGGRRPGGRPPVDVKDATGGPAHLQQRRHQFVQLHPAFLAQFLQLQYQIAVQLHGERHQAQCALALALFAAVGRGGAGGRTEGRAFRAHLVHQFLCVALGQGGFFHGWFSNI